MEKYMKLIPGFIVGILCIVVYKFGINGLISNEISYSMNGMEPRYVDKFRYTPIYTLPTVKDTAFEMSGDAYSEKLRSLEPKIMEALKWVSLNENIIIILTNLGNYAMTLRANGGTMTFDKGIKEGFVPTLVIPLSTQDIDGLEQFLSDWTLSKDETLKITDVVLWPMIERIYRLSRFYRVEHMSNFWFDDFMQFEISGWENITRAGTPINLRYTIVNVDGQWIVMKGFIWDPDIRYSLSLEEAGVLYNKMVHELEDSKSKVEALAHSTDILEILQRNITYIRKDHE